MTLIQEGNRLNIEGNIKSTKDFEEIEAAVEGLLNGYESIILNITDSMSLTSSVIGYLVKVVNENGKKVYLNVGSNDLYTLLDELDLLNVFYVKRI